MVSSLLFAFGVLWGLEKLASEFKEDVTGNPMTPSTEGLGHPFLLWEMPPGIAQVNGQQVTVNAIGARGPEVSLDKPTGIRRVISLGGDMAFGRGVQRAETYSVDAVKSLGGSRVGVETILLAVPEYTIEQTLNLMSMRGWDLNPDLLIISGPSHEMSVSPYVDKSVISRFQSTAVINSSINDMAMFRILDHWLRVDSGPKATRRESVFSKGRNINADGRPRVGTNDYAHALNAIVDTAVSKSVDVVFVMLPTPEDLRDSPFDNRVTLYREAMTIVAKRHGVPVVDGPTLFKDSGRTQTELFSEGSVMTRRGHRTLGYALTQKLRPWMRGRKLTKKGTGEAIPPLEEPASMEMTF